MHGGPAHRIDLPEDSVLGARVGVAAPPKARSVRVVEPTTAPAPAQKKAAAPTDAKPVEKGRRAWLSPMSLFYLAAAFAVWLGPRLQLDRYITPEDGAGYWLGIAGGSMMVITLLYASRKRVKWLGFLGSVKSWFELHIVLGILGPVLVLYHSNFGTGATNSNVALYCMLLVAGSGIVGRYFHTRVHSSLDDHHLTLAELKTDAEKLRQLSSTNPFLPQLAERLDALENDLLARVARTPMLLKPLVARVRALVVRSKARAYVRQTVRTGEAAMSLTRPQRARLRGAAIAFVDRRVLAVRRVAVFDAYERLFSFWHVLHLPLFFMLIIAGVVHVFAVHIY